MVEQAAWILVLDFGTSFTVAASKIGDRPPEVIEVGGDRRVPSVVMVDEAGHPIVGRRADDLAATHPDRTLRALKNRLGDQAPVVLGGRPYQVVNLVAELLRGMYVASVSQVGSEPAEVRLTHPATWNRPRQSRLLEAAAKAGLPRPGLVPEPVAAAMSFATEVGVEPGAHVAVYDLGGGTFDSAIVTAGHGGFFIVGRPGGDQNIGGELFDEMVVNHLGTQLPPASWEAIQIGDDLLWRQVGAALRAEARRAKEALSGNEYADLIVPLPSGLQQVRLSRVEFEAMVEPFIAETVLLLQRCVEEAGLESMALAGISLVGGSTRSPIVLRMVQEAFPNIPVLRRGDPKTSVATGAALVPMSTLVVVTKPSDQITQEAAAGTAPQAVRLAAPPPPAVPAAAAPPPPPSSVPPVAPRPLPPPPTQLGGFPESRAPVDESSPRPTKRRWVAVAAAVLVAAAITGGVVLATRDDESSSGATDSTSAAVSSVEISTVDSGIETKTSVDSTIAPVTVAATVTTAVPATTAPATTVPVTTMPVTTVPATTVPPTTAPAPTTSAPPAFGTLCARSNIDFAALRAAPAVASRLLAQIPAGSCDVVLVDEVPFLSNGIDWYHVQWSGIDGWTAVDNYVPRS